jgi:hypothetical protein
MLARCQETERGRTPAHVANTLPAAMRDFANVENTEKFAEIFRHVKNSRETSWWAPQLAKIRDLNPLNRGYRAVLSAAPAAQKAPAQAC